MSTPKASHQQSQLIPPPIDICPPADPVEAPAVPLHELFKTTFLVINAIKSNRNHFLFSFFFQGRSNELTSVLDKKLGDCSDIARYIGGLLDIERAHYQGIEKLLQKFPPALSCEGNLVNAAWSGIHAWVSAKLVDAGDRVRTIKEFKERFESYISSWEQSKKRVNEITNNIYLYIFSKLKMFI